MADIKKYDTISSELKFTNPYWDYRIDKYVLPSGEYGDYHYVDSKGACIVIPRLANNTFVMVRQYRYLNMESSLEFPGGGLNKRLSEIENAQKELSEESGFSAGKIKEIGMFNPFKGVTNEICKVFLAEGLVKTDAAPDDSEEFEIFYLSEEDITKKIIDGEIWDGMSIVAWYLFQNKIGRH